ncbi:alpha-2-macroglobulin [Ferruginibacter lapsinanis]|uniref:alpha-2-macroglobulin family protein n=1 Tax=Ferruginibacter lapsinanis TaxID=563172 RepID=UPI001E655900|nr:alpha-2-macroglobulin family protein [Ferruginibacter lapsinanis]UEG51270.1 alpha-2-macroglobulin [Ferruginibacter lapsinanis]
MGIAQTKNDFVANWKKVEAYEKKGLTKSALKEVLVIYTLAIKDKNDAQQIKSCMYQIKYRNMMEEDSRENNIFLIDTLIAKAKAPAKNILQSMQAEMFWQYLQNNRWKFYSRTKLAEEKSNDITTWSIDKIHATISELYISSIANDALLKKTRLEGLEAIIIKGENTRQLRATLFDFLTHRALSYFMTDENDLTKPAYQFEIKDAKVFAPANEFIHASFITKDTMSMHHRALLLLQNVLQFHINDTKPDALLDADLIRLDFVNQYAVNENKEKLYEAALKSIERKYGDNSVSAQASYLRAQIYFNKGQDFDPIIKTDNQYEIKRAKEICEATINKFPKSEGGINCKNLLNQILQPSLNLESEKVNIPNQPFRTLVKYKNSKNVYFRIIKTSRDEIKKMDRRDYEKLWKDVASIKYEKNWSVTLPDPADYQDHSVEVKVEGLPLGTYFILASLDEKFSVSKNILARQLVYVSNISYISNNKKEFYVLNRDNGFPLAGTEVQLWESRYNYSKSEYEDTKAEKYVADKNGSFTIKKATAYRNFLLQLKNGNDELFMDDNQYDNVYNSYVEEPKPTTFLFTDRSIYRPGQIIYFKGIVVQNGTEVSDKKIVSSFVSDVQLKDANGQKVGNITMTTNEYGSYHGSFKLPVGGLGGQFSLEDMTTGSLAYFNVEEYKRPKFFVEVEKPKGTYHVNDSIHVTGTAKAYAGNNVDGATVKYRVVRKVRYPIWWGWGGYIRKGRGGYPMGRNEEMEIANGELVTNAKGEFVIDFKALPDESINKKNQPTFYYEVNADVTDINGETRSAETSMAVAYQALKIDIVTAEKLQADSLKNIQISSTNINDIFEKATVNVTIYKVQSPDKIFRERFWGQPDQFIMSKDEYYTIFPYDVYKDEDQMKAWEIKEKVVDITDTTSENSTFNIQHVKLSLGWYKIIAIAKDKYGEDVKAEKYIEVSDGRLTTDVRTAITIDSKKTSVEPGEKIQYNIKTGFDNIWLIHTISKMDKTVLPSYLSVNNNQPYQNEIVTTENDRGGIGLNYVFVKHNRIYTGSENFTIPWSNKELTISYSTFRDKLLPGAKEKWTVKISGNKGEKIAAEILAGMYDASLDQFKPHNWNKLDIWPNLYNTIDWTSTGFRSVYAELYNKAEREDITQLPKSYDRLLSFGNEYVRSYRERMYKSARSESSKEAKLEDALAAPSITSSKYTPAKIVKDEDVAAADSSKPLWWINPLDYAASELKNKANEASVQIRKNFNETAFFFPDLTTDVDGNVSFSFAMPEALTKWKLMTFAHNKNLASAYSEKSVITQKPLMVQPNAPRFLREGDKIEFSAKIVNMLDTFFAGKATLELFDAVTNEPVNKLFKNISFTQSFLTWPKQSALVKFPIEIPSNFGRPLLYRIKAEAAVPNYQNGETFSDGEEMALPVLTNRMLVTETMPINLRSTTKKDFKFEKLLGSGVSSTISNNSLTVEYTSNPAWYAVQALPYLMEYPYECAEQTFNRFYANTLATHISNSMPKIKAVFEKWKNVDTAALMSNLQKNEELKSALLQETPWVMEAQNESQQKKNIALLFDMVKMSTEAEKAIAKLKEMQSSNGGFVWFKGGPDDRYITQYILTGIGHLKKLNALPVEENREALLIVSEAIPYLDKKIKEEYEYLVKHKVNLAQNNLSYTAIQYLYMRSFFSEYKISANVQTAYTYYRDQSKKYWLGQTKYMQAMIALALHRGDDAVTPKAIIKSLKENAITKEEMGMYWKEWTTGGYWWHQAPIESQALMVEAFTDIDKNAATVDDLKTWLLKQKQTQNWKTTKATAEACYALLLGGSNWLAEEKEITIQLGNTTIRSTDASTEAGTGYFKKRIEGKDVVPQMGNISVSSNSSKVPPLEGGGGSTSWGAIYWQYFEDLDKITPAATPLKLVKKLFVERNTERGPELVAIKDGDAIKVGDKIKVRIELRVDRDMEYIHMKDMRAACMEPVNVISEYKWQGGLGYYESTKDASTNFFFNYLNRGSYVFEYPMFVTHSGNFSNGITTIQCMYAPEFTSHSEGVRVNVQ